MKDKLHGQFNGKDNQKDQVCDLKGFIHLRIVCNERKCSHAHHNSVNGNEENNQELDVSVVDNGSTSIAQLINNVHSSTHSRRRRLVTIAAFTSVAVSCVATVILRASQAAIVVIVVVFVAIVVVVMVVFGTVHIHNGGLQFLAGRAYAAGHGQSWLLFLHSRRHCDVVTIVLCRIMFPFFNVQDEVVLLGKLP
jgi:hypothetical protein